MIVSIYNHPAQTLISSWDVDSDIPVLTRYEELPAVEAGISIAELDTVSSIIQDVTIVNIIVHASNVLYHRYPVESGESETMRRSFELATCLPSIDPSDDVIDDFSLPALIHGSSWHGIVAAKHDTASLWSRISDNLTIVTDVAADIRAVQRAHMANTSDLTAHIALRGTMWWCSLFDASGCLVHLACLPYNSDSYEQNVYDIIQDHQAVIDGRIARVVVAGDGLKPSSLETIKSRFLEMSVNVKRANPFPAVRSTIDAERTRECLRKAHILGPLVGSLSA